MDQSFAAQYRFLFALLLLALTIGLGYFVEQTDFYLMLPLYFSFFVIYLFVYKNIEAKNTIQFYLYLAILLRLILVFSLPNLSDDVYRFIWDGRLLNNGLNPFEQLPQYYIDTTPNVEGITPELFAQLNSPNYFTIYPPVCQATFALATFLFPTSVWASALVMKLFLFGCEVGSLFLLKKLLNGSKKVLLYALNPLIIIEICGNLHFEGAMVFFLLLAYYLLLQQRLTWSAIAMALSVASKLLPLIFLPFLIKRLGWKKSIQYFIIVGVTLVLLFAPLVSGAFIENFGNSLDLYFRKFEFNASLYYVIRWVAFLFSGYNLIAIIGPILALCVLVGVCLMAYKEKVVSNKNLPLKMLFAICLYLACTTTMHPWYVSLPLVLCLFTDYRFPVLWSGLIFLTYINYSYPSFSENMWIVGLEYVCVFSFFIWELKMKPKNISSTN